MTGGDVTGRYMTGRYMTGGDITALPDLAHEWSRTGPVRTRRPEYVDLLPPCNDGCPAGEDIQGWLAHTAARHHERAWRALVADNPFPAIEGRVCYHPCETVCNRAQLDEAVSVHAVERFLGDDRALELGWGFPAPAPGTAPAPAPAPGTAAGMAPGAAPAPGTAAGMAPGAAPAPGTAAATGKRVLVVGAGPSGLSAPYHLARRGHEVEVRDAGPEPGGMMRYGIPAYRLPRDVLEAEIDRLSGLGIRTPAGSCATRCSSAPTRPKRSGWRLWPRRPSTSPGTCTRRWPPAPQGGSRPTPTGCHDRPVDHLRRPAAPQPAKGRRLAPQPPGGEGVPPGRRGRGT